MMMSSATDDCDKDERQQRRKSDGIDNANAPTTWEGKKGLECFDD